MVTLPRWRIRNSSRTAEPDLRRDRFTFVDHDEGKQLLDAQARKYLHMSGEEFSKRYRSGDLKDSHRPEVIRVSLLLPFAGHGADGKKKHA